MEMPKDFVDANINDITREWLRQMGLPQNDDGLRMFAHLEITSPAYHARMLRKLKYRLKNVKRSAQPKREPKPYPGFPFD